MFLLIASAFMAVFSRHYSTVMWKSRAGRCTCMIFSMTGREKARVLPEPVLALPIRSLPLIAGSKTCF